MEADLLERVEAYRTSLWESVQRLNAAADIADQRFPDEADTRELRQLSRTLELIVDDLGRLAKGEWVIWTNRTKEERN